MVRAGFGRMSVIRRPVTGRRRRTRIGDARTAFWVAVVDAGTVGCWFGLVVLETRSVFTALAGLGVLSFGALIRTGLIASSLGGIRDVGRPQWLVVAGAYAAIWIGWLLVAEWIGGVAGVLVAGTLLAVFLGSHSSIEYRLARPWTDPTVSDRSTDWRAAVVIPAVALAVGATALLGFVWFGESTLFETSIALGRRTVVFEIHAALNGVALLGCSSFVGTHRLLSEQSLP